MVKKNDLTLDEKLKEALVPDWAHPYAVPSNWVWTYILSAFNITSSKRVHKSDWLSDGIPFYRTRELVKLSNQGFVDNELFISQEMYLQFKEVFGVPVTNDLLISGVGTIGIPYVIANDDKFYFKDGNVIWFQNKGLANAQYIFYLYKSHFIKNQIHEVAAGSTVDTYTIINAKNTKFPLPPLAEQERIVKRIESLFSKLDTAKELAQSALDSFANRKSAILHQAFTGELTKNWREDNGVSLDSWEETTLNELCTKITDGTHHSPNNSASGEYMYITAKNIKESGVIFEKITYVSKKDFEEIYSRCNVEYGDVLYIKDGATTGVATVNQVKTPFAMLSSVALLKPNYKLSLSKYIKYCLNSSDVKAMMIDNMAGSAITRLTISKIKTAKIIIPTLPEQTEIVRILDSLLEKEEEAKELTNVITQIDHMKKAILARAFRGELDTNDPQEESALKLLKEILEENV